MNERAIVPFLAAALACSGVQTIEVPACSRPGAIPETPMDCRSVPAVSIYRRKAVEILDHELRSEHFESKRIGVEFDAIHAAQSVCVDEEPNALPWVARRELARSGAALRKIQHVPECLAGTHLDLTEELTDAADASGFRQHAPLQRELDWNIRGSEPEPDEP